MRAARRRGLAQRRCTDPIGEFLLGSLRDQPARPVENCARDTRRELFLRVAQQLADGGSIVPRAKSRLLSRSVVRYKPVSEAEASEPAIRLARASRRSLRAARRTNIPPGRSCGPHPELPRIANRPSRAPDPRTRQRATCGQNASRWPQRRTRRHRQGDHLACHDTAHPLTTPSADLLPTAARGGANAPPLRVGRDRPATELSPWR